jgi:hypothetical protein
MEATIIGYSLMYDGTWQCVYVGDSLAECHTAIKSHGPWSGHAVALNWTGEPFVRIKMDLEMLCPETADALHYAERNRQGK